MSQLIRSSVRSIVVWLALRACHQPYAMPVGSAPAAHVQVPYLQGVQFYRIAELQAPLVKMFGQEPAAAAKGT
jgi:hypothetical protein